MDRDSIYLAFKTVVGGKYRDLCQELKVRGLSPESERAQQVIWDRQIITAIRTIADSLEITVERQQKVA